MGDPERSDKPGGIGPTDIDGAQGQDHRERQALNESDDDEAA
jgi:hypothetical protein